MSSTPHAEPAITCRVNPATRPAGSTVSMIFGVEHIVWYLSQLMTLQPGDLIATGTPAEGASEPAPTSRSETSWNGR